MGQLGCVDGGDGIVEFAQLGPLFGRSEVPIDQVETITTDASQQRVEGLGCELFPVVVPVGDLVFEFVKHVLVHDQDAARVRPFREIDADVVLLNPAPSCAGTGWMEILTKGYTGQGERVIDAGDGRADEVLSKLEACLRADNFVAHGTLRVS